MLRKHSRGSITKSQKLSSVANVKDSHAQNDRTVPFQSEIILIAFMASFEKCINGFGMCCVNSQTYTTTLCRFVNAKFTQRRLANHVCLRILNTCANSEFRISNCRSCKAQSTAKKMEIRKLHKYPGSSDRCDWLKASVRISRSRTSERYKWRFVNSHNTYRNRLYI